MNHKILSDDFLINGMPCHKYILRQLTTTADAVTFTKTYVNTMITAGASYDEVENSLPLLSFRLNSNSPVSGHDFASRENSLQGLSLIDAIRLDDNVPTFRKCDTFYKKFDPKRIACRLCPLSTKYLNRQYSLEKSIMSYALSSPDAFRYVQEQGISSDHFQSVIDIMGYFSYANKPSCYPLYSQTFAALQNETIRNDFFTSKEQGKPSWELIAYHDTCMTNSYVPRGLISSELMRKLGEILSDELLSGTVPAESEIRSLITTLLTPDLTENPNTRNSAKSNIRELDTAKRKKQQQERSNTQIAEKSNMGIDTLEKFYSNNPTEYSSKKEPIKETKNKCSRVRLVEYEPVTLNDLLTNIEPSKTDLLLNEKTAAETSISFVFPSNDFVIEQGNTCAAVVDSEVVNRLPGKNVSYMPVPDEQILIEELSNNPASLESFSCETIHKSMVVIPTVPVVELQHFALNLDSENVRLLSMFESYVTKDQKLSIELIKTNTGENLLLLYSPRMRAFFYTTMESLIVKEILVPLLEHSSVKKYCYYPYATLGALWQMGIYAKGIFSLFSISTFLYGDHQLDMSTTLEKMGAIPAIGGVTIKPTGEITSIPLRYMHAYANIFHRTKNEITHLGFLEEFEQKNNFDRILSYSYYLDHYFKKGTVLFTIETANHYRFHQNLGPTLPSYETITYFFTNAPGIPNNMIYGIIDKLDSSGLFRKFKMVITSISSTSFSLCIRKKDYKTISTLLNTALLSYLRENDLSGIEYRLDVNHIHPF